MRILIMGLPGSGKTTLARELFKFLSDEEGSASWANADAVRHYYKDWDFSYEGRIRQSHRMRKLADEDTNRYFIADFVAPLPEMREIFDADIIIWMDTVIESKYENTNNCFVDPDKVDFRVIERDYKKWSQIIYNSII